MTHTGKEEAALAMDVLEVERRCIDIIARSKLLPPTAVTPEMTFDELNIDSLDKINISFEVEEVFSITIPDEALSTLRTVRDVIDGVVRLRQLPVAKPVP